MTRSEAGLGLLKCFYLQPELLDEANVLSSDFIESHQMLEVAMRSLADKKLAIDLSSILEALKKAGNEVQGSVISELIDGAVNPYNWKMYEESLIDIVRTEELSKVLHTAHNVLREEGYQASIDMIESAFTKAERRGSSEKRAGEYLTDVIDRLKSYRDNKTSYSGLETGTKDFDNLTGGLQKKELVVLAARPSIGKTTLALQWADFISSRKTPVGFISLEMAGNLLIEKLVIAKAGKDQTKIRNGFFAKSEFADLNHSMEEVYEQPLFIDESISLSIGQLKGLVRRWKRVHGIKALFIDYLTKIQHGDKKMERRLQIGDFTHELKGLAKELEIPVVVLAQLDRKAEGQVPTMNMLRESADIEQDADVIIFLHRDRNNDQEPTKIIVEKNRNGTTGTIETYFAKAKGRFENLQKEYER